MLFLMPAGVDAEKEVYWTVSDVRQPLSYLCGMSED